MVRARRAAEIALALDRRRRPAGGRPPGRAGAAGPAAVVAWPASTLVVSEVQTGGAIGVGRIRRDREPGRWARRPRSGSRWSTRRRRGRPSPARRRGRVARPRRRAGGSCSSTAVGGVRRRRRPRRTPAGSPRPVGRSRCGSSAGPCGFGRLGRCAERLRRGIAASPRHLRHRALERRPGGAAGNATDTNDNAIDWFISGMPAPQNLASPAVPGVTPTPTPTPSRHGDTESDAGCDTDSGSHSGSHVGSDCDAYADRRTDAHSDA